MPNEYVGELPLNARISIDYKDNSYKVEYPEKTKFLNILFTVFSFYLAMYLKYFVFWVSLLVLIGGIFLSVKEIEEIDFQTIESQLKSLYEFSYYLIILITYLTAPPMIYTLYMFIKKGLLGEKYPRHTVNELIKTEGYTEKIFTEIDDKRLIIPHFENMYIKYWITKDFKKYLRKVNIKDLRADIIYKNEKEDTDPMWYVEFIFSKIPKEGYLRVMWI